MGIEYELKYGATPEIQEKILEAWPGETRIFSMETTYYDTPDGALSARRCTLRIRLENGTPVCTVKTPGTGGARGEWEVAAADLQQAVPALCRLGAPPELEVLTRQGLLPICSASFTRIARTLVLPDCTLELAADRGSLAGGGRTVPLCEVEVELKAGTREAADRFAAQMAQQFRLQTEPRSKFRRALALYKGEQP